MPEPIMQSGSSYLNGTAGPNPTLGTATNTATIAAATLLDGIIEGTPTGAANYTLDTAANISAALGSANVGDTFSVLLVNTSGGANTITIVTNTGLTLKGSTGVNVAQNKCALLTFRCTATTPTYTVYISICN